MVSEDLDRLSKEVADVWKIVAAAMKAANDGDKAERVVRYTQGDHDAVRSAIRVVLTYGVSLAHKQAARCEKLEARIAELEDQLTRPLTQ